MSDALDVPLCRDDPAWGECGDLRSPDFGTVFAWPAAGRARMLTYDRKGRRHALTVFDGRQVRQEIVIQGRRFTVADGTPAGGSPNVA